jgi:hypothetical protein
VIVEKPELEGFTVQTTPRSERHWLVVCDRCACTWYLPINPEKRTHDALGILYEHAERHDDEA